MENDKKPHFTIDDEKVEGEVKFENASIESVGLETDNTVSFTVRKNNGERTSIEASGGSADKQRSLYYQVSQEQGGDRKVVRLRESSISIGR